MRRGSGKDPLKDMANECKVCCLGCTAKLAPYVAIVGSRFERKVLEPEKLW